MQGNIASVTSEQIQQGYWRRKSELAIIWLQGGSAVYNAGSGAFLVDDDCYLVLNQAQASDCTIKSEGRVTALCVCFSSRVVGETLRSHLFSAEAPHWSPTVDYVDAFSFFQRTYPHNRFVSPVLKHIQESYFQRRKEIRWLDEQCHLLLRRMLLVHQQSLREVAALPVARFATKEDLYRRLHLARDYIRAHFNRPLPLREIASVACLSRNHLLRTFRQAFDQTPHQFLISERLRQAKWLLANTDNSVTQICLEVGFESLGSFGWLFKRRFNVAPQAFRDSVNRMPANLATCHRGKHADNYKLQRHSAYALPSTTD